MKNKEIERKFLVIGEYKNLAENSHTIAQGYLSSDPLRTVRVRIKSGKAFLTIKGESEKNGLIRFEWEKEIQVNDAEELLKLCETGLIEKNRYEIPYKGHIFEVDEFHGENEGLVIAELELSSETEAYELPEWIGEEVTGKKEYYNSWISKHPYNFK